MSPSAHGDFERWQAAVSGLRSASDDAERRALLMRLAPWRKGPFDIGGVHIDAEWRSDLKWQRVEGAIESLAGRRVLDVGCGNGYYALRMADAGADAVLGIDPTLLYVMQFLGRLPSCRCVSTSCRKHATLLIRRSRWGSCITSGRHSTTCGNCAQLCVRVDNSCLKRSSSPARNPTHARQRIATHG